MEHTEMSCSADSSVIRAGVVYGCLALGALWPVLFWDWFSENSAAFGFNATIYLGLVFLLIERAVGRSLVFSRHSWGWSGPVLLVAASYSLFENPFFRLFIPLFIWPALWLLVYRARAQSSDAIFERARVLLPNLIYRSLLAPLLSLTGAVDAALQSVVRLVPYLSFTNSATFRSIVRGVVILALLGGCIVLPLLSSVDDNFERLVSSLLMEIEQLLLVIFQGAFWAKVLWSLLVALLLLTTLISWAHSKSEPTVSKGASQEKDPITGLVVVAGLLLVYLVFIWLQIERLFLGGLPTDWAATLAYVKGGFWQMIAISAINIALIGCYLPNGSRYLRTALGCFLSASVVLLLSAAHRMLLYITYHGLSYEKFYASYTVLFCFLAFALIGLTMLRIIRATLLKSLYLLFTWMFGLISVLPVEQSIARFNFQVQALNQSKVQLWELRKLSIDALSFIEGQHLELEKRGWEVHTCDPHTDWRSLASWVTKIRKALGKKSGFEHSLSSLWQKAKTADLETEFYAFITLRTPDGHLDYPLSCDLPLGELTEEDATLGEQRALAESVSEANKKSQESLQGRQNHRKRSGANRDVCTERSGVVECEPFQPTSALPAKEGQGRKAKNQPKNGS